MSTTETPTEPAAARLRAVPPTARDAARVTCAGELDILSVPDLDRSLRRAEADAALVVIDLSDVELVDVRRRPAPRAAHDATISIVGVPQHVRQVLEFCDIDGVVAGRTGAEHDPPGTLQLRACSAAPTTKIEGSRR